MYRLLFHPKAVKKLRKLHPIDRDRILAKLKLFSKETRTKNLDVKKLVNTQRSFRIRSGDVRAIFELDEKKKTVYVWDVDYRGSIY